MHSYLTNRQQRVKIKSNTDEYSIIDTGGSQGTILEPLFFILYINDLLTVMPSDSIVS